MCSEFCSARPTQSGVEMCSGICSARPTRIGGEMCSVRPPQSGGDMCSRICSDRPCKTDLDSFASRFISEGELKALEKQFADPLDRLGFRPPWEKKGARPVLLRKREKILQQVESTSIYRKTKTGYEFYVSENLHGEIVQAFTKCIAI